MVSFRRICLAIIVAVPALYIAGCSPDTSDPFNYIELGQYKGLSVPRSSYAVTEEELSEELDMLANAYADADGNVPELTDGFIRDISGGQYADMAAYTKALEEQMKSEYEEFYDLQYYEDLWNLAVDNAKVIRDFPADYLQKKTERSVISAHKYAQSLDMTFDEFVKEKMGLTVEEFNKEAIEYANKAAKESMVLAAIAKNENITVTDADIDKAIKEYVDLGAYGSEEEFYREGPERMEELKEYILMSKVQDFLAGSAKEER